MKQCTKNLGHFYLVLFSKYCGYYEIPQERKNGTFLWKMSKFLFENKGMKRFYIRPLNKARSVTQIINYFSSCSSQVW